MFSHGYICRGNEKQTRTTLKNIYFVLLRMLNLLKVLYTSYIIPSTEPRFFFSGKGEAFKPKEGRLIRRRLFEAGR